MNPGKFLLHEPHFYVFSVHSGRVVQNVSRQICQHVIQQIIVPNALKWLNTKNVFLIYNETNWKEESKETVEPDPTLELIKILSHATD